MFSAKLAKATAVSCTAVAIHPTPSPAMRTHLLIVAALLLAACGKFPNYNDEAGQALPANFPKDVFLPKDYSVRSSVELHGALAVELVAPVVLADVLAAARAVMPGMGWRETAFMQQDEITILIFQNDAQAVQYSFEDDESGKAYMSVNVMKNN
jgi:hypothetical protein